MGGSLIRSVQYVKDFKTSLIEKGPQIGERRSRMQQKVLQLCIDMSQWK